MKKRIGLLLVLLLCFLLVQPVLGDEPVTDDTGRYLTASQILELKQKSLALLQKHGIRAVYLITSSLGEDLNRMRYYAADVYDDTYGNNSDGVIFLVAGRSYISVTTAKGEEILTTAVLDAIEDDVVGYLRDGDYAGAFSRYLDDLDSVLVRYENGERFSEYRFSLKTALQRAVAVLPILALFSAVVTSIVILIRRSKMKTAKKKETASSYAIGAELTRRSDVYLYTTTVRHKIETSSGGGSHGGGGHFSSSGGGHGSSHGGHF